MGSWTVLKLKEEGNRGTVTVKEKTMMNNKMRLSKLALYTMIRQTSIRVYVRERGLLLLPCADVLFS